MATFKLKRVTTKSFSEEDQQKGGMSTGAKAAIGTGIAGALAIGGGLLARHGAFGAKAMKSVNNAIANVGKTVSKAGDNAIGRFGNKMVTSGEYRSGIAERGLNLNKSWTNDIASGGNKLRQTLRDDLWKQNNVDQATGAIWR